MDSNKEENEKEKQFREKMRERVNLTLISKRGREKKSQLF